MSFYGRTAGDLLELASDQRLQILLNLLESNSKISQMANQISATRQEVYRNFNRLLNCGFVAKNSKGEYYITTYGKAICKQLPTFLFFENNRQYFENHSLVGIPEKFVMRVGQLNGGQHIKGVVKVLEQCKSIYNNAQEYVYEILAELSLERITTLAARTQQDVRLSYIVSETAIVPKGRKRLLEKIGFKKLIDKGFIERKMQKQVHTMIVLNEKEACIVFPRTNSQPDLSEAIYSNNDSFYDWCFDYFMHCWNNAGPWQESKLKE